MRGAGSDRPGRLRRAPTLADLSGQGLVLATRFAGAKRPPGRIHRRNRENRFTQTYRKPDGDPAVVAALPIPLASRGALAEFFRAYRGTLEEFTEIAGGGIHPDEPPATKEV